MLLVEWFDAHKGDRTRRGCGVPGRLAVIKAGLEEAGWSGPTRPWRNDEVTLGTHYPRSGLMLTKAIRLADCKVPGRLAVIKAGLEEAGWSGPTRPWRNDEVTLGTHYPRPSSHISAPIARAGPRLRRLLPTLSMEDQHEPRSPGDAVCWHGYRVRQRNLALNPP